jgi:hypothetical protein
MAKLIIVKKGNNKPTMHGACPWFVDYAAEKKQ